MLQNLATLVCSQDAVKVEVDQLSLILELLLTNVSLGHHVITSLKLFVDDESHLQLEELYVTATTNLAAKLADEASEDRKRKMLEILALLAFNAPETDLTSLFKELSRCLLSLANDVTEVDVCQSLLSDASGDVIRGFSPCLWSAQKSHLLRGNDTDEGSLVCAVLKQRDRAKIWKDFLQLSLEKKQHFLELIVVSGLSI